MAGSPYRLWYRRPARRWVEALPVGNGRLGAMVFGGVERERLQLNEDTLFAGGPYDPNDPDAAAALPEVRRLIFAGEYRAADRLVDERMMGRPRRQLPYQPIGDLWLDFAAAGDGSGDGDAAAEPDAYRRELDLDSAVAAVAYRRGRAAFKREVFASPVDQVIAVRLAANRPGNVGFDLSFSSPQNVAVRAEAGGLLVADGRNGAVSGVEGRLRFQVRVRVLAEGGTAEARGGRIAVRGADAATVLVAIATSFRSWRDVSGDPEALARNALEAAAARPYAALRRDHVREHRKLFRRVRLDLGRGASGAPTDERPARFAAGRDPALAALYFQYGRYLLISSSRPGTQPANLQGIWNEAMAPPWDSKLTVNINAEMNYWPAETTNLAECHEPLLRLTKELAESGARTARAYYGAGGWVCHHNTDLWRATAPIDGPLWGMWPTGGAWLCLHLWDHYAFSGDRAFLADAFPAMLGAARFFVDTLAADPRTGFLVTCPSLSPENAHPGGVAVCAGPAMDGQILRALFGACLDAAAVLGIADPLLGPITSARDRLPPPKIGRSGQLQEWDEDWDMAAPEPNHRHVSHLFGLYPGDQIDAGSTPELFAAARRSLESRGDAGTGWSLAWKINLWARLGDGDRAYALLVKALNPVEATEETDYSGGGGVYPNLFDAHPPFQIDGNFGAAAGIAEMLLRSRAGEIRLLPALPAAWPEGGVSGLRARGGFTAAIAWKGGALTGATISAGADPAPCVVRCGERSLRLSLAPGAAVDLDGELRVRPAASRREPAGAPY
jgi:alpha-L-fucosidase 2